MSAFEQVGDAEALLSAHPLRPLTPESLRKQASTLGRLPEMTVEALCHDNPRLRTWYNRRAVLARHWHMQVSACLTNIDRLFWAEAWGEWRQSCRQLQAYVTLLRAVREAKPPPRSDAPRRVKRQRIPREKDWRERVWAATGPAHRLAVALLCLLPLKPRDLAAGVSLDVGEEPYIVVEVAASGPVAGADFERRFAVDPRLLPAPAKPPVLELLQALAAAKQTGQGRLRVISHPRTLDRALKRASRKVWPRKSVSAMAFRATFMQGPVAGGNVQLDARICRGSWDLSGLSSRRKRKAHFRLPAYVVRDEVWGRPVREGPHLPD